MWVSRRDAAPADQLERLRELARLVQSYAEPERTITRALEAARVLLDADELRLDFVGHGPGSPQPSGADHRPAALRLPLEHGGYVHGWLTVVRDAGPFTARERATARRVAADVAALTSRDNWFVTSVDAASQERERIAQELHESVTQTLYAVSMMADALPGAVERDRTVAREASVRLRELVLTALAELRSILLELRPERLGSLTLPELIHDRVAAVVDRFEIELEIDFDLPSGAEAEPDLPIEAKLVIQRVVRELLSNVARHAGARRVAIRLDRTPDGGGRLTVSDDGIGFEPAGVGRSHLGLVMAKEDLAAIGATLDIDSLPGRGTSAVIAWPAAEGDTPGRAVTTWNGGATRGRFSDTRAGRR